MDVGLYQFKYKLYNWFMNMLISMVFAVVVHVVLRLLLEKWMFINILWYSIVLYSPIWFVVHNFIFYLFYGKEKDLRFRIHKLIFDDFCILAIYALSFGCYMLYFELL